MVPSPARLPVHQRQVWHWRRCKRAGDFSEARPRYRRQIRPGSPSSSTENCWRHNGLGGAQNQSRRDSEQLDNSRSYTHPYPKHQSHFITHSGVGYLSPSAASAGLRPGEKRPRHSATHRNALQERRRRHLRAPPICPAPPVLRASSKLSALASKVTPSRKSPSTCTAPRAALTATSSRR
jgi:hypothetical protein